MELLEYIAKMIQDLRTSYGEGEGISQEALAKEIGVKPNTVSRWETGTYRPTIEDLDDLARFFGVSIMKFFPPDNKTIQDDKITALLRVAKQLHPKDLEELRRYAEFRRARNLYAHEVRPRAGRKRKEAK